MSVEYNTHPGEERRIELSAEREVESVGATTEVKTDPYLDGEDVMERLARVQSWFRQEIEWQAEERNERLTDHEFYDSHQWKDEDKAEVEARGQQAFVFNMIKESVDVLSGSQRLAKIDYQILPRHKNDRKAAELKTKGFKYLTDVNNLFIHRSWASKDQIVSGLGWVDTGIRSDSTLEPLYYQYEDWRNCWYDHLAQGPDYMRACRFNFRAKWADIDYAAAMFPERGGHLLESSAMEYDSSVYGFGWEDDVFPFGGEDLDDDGWSLVEADLSDASGRRNRVLLIECQYKMPFQNVKLIDGKHLGSLHGQIYDPNVPTPELDALIESGYASLVDSRQTVTRQMIFSGNSVMQDIVIPYNHNRSSLIPLWAFRRKKTGAPYGLVRALRDPQEDLNKRRSKALYQMSTNRVIADRDAVEDRDELYEEANRSDGMIFKKKGSELKIHNESAIGREHVQLAEQDLNYIERSSGITDEARGLQTNAVSGAAITARQQSSQVATSEYRENRQFFDQQAGQNLLSLMEQFWVEPKTIRVAGDAGGYDFYDMNTMEPADEMETAEDDITASQADFIVTAAPFSDSQRQAARELLGEIIKGMPEQIQLMLIDLYLELHDHPLVSSVGAQRVRQALGLQDPSADPESEEVQAEKQARQAEDERQKAIEDQLLQLEMMMKEAKANRDAATAEKDLASTDEIVAKIDKIYAEIDAMKAKTVDDSKNTIIKKATALNQIEQGERMNNRQPMQNRR